MDICQPFCLHPNCSWFAPCFQNQWVCIYWFYPSFSWFYNILPDLPDSHCFQVKFRPPGLQPLLHLHREFLGGAKHASFASHLRCTGGTGWDGMAWTVHRWLTKSPRKFGVFESSNNSCIVFFLGNQWMSLILLKGWWILLGIWRIRSQLELLTSLGEKHSNLEDFDPQQMWVEPKKIGSQSTQMWL